MSRRIAAIQRRCGERTAAPYFTWLRDFDAAHAVEGGDLLDVARDSLLTAVRDGSEWVLFVDADMRVYPGARDAIERLMHTVPGDVYQVRFLCDDRITGECIYGAHLHRGALVAQAYEWFLARAERTLKAESHNVRRFMDSAGLRTLDSRIVVASHDFGQFYRDLYAKYVVRGLRRPRRIGAMEARLAPRRADPDVSAALAGLARARLDPPGRTAGRVGDSAEKVLAALGREEKSPMLGACEADDDRGVRLGAEGHGSVRE